MDMRSGEKRSGDWIGKINNSSSSLNNSFVLYQLFKNTRRQRYVFYLAAVASALVSFSLNGMLKDLIAYADSVPGQVFYLITAVIFCVLSVTFTFLSVWLKGPFSIRAGMFLRDLVYRNVFSLSSARLAHLGSTRVVALFSKNIQEYCSSLTTSIDGLAVNLLILIFGLLIFAYFDWKILLFYLTVLLVLLLLWVGTRRGFQRLRRSCRDSNLQLSDLALRIFGGLSIIRAHGAQDQYFEILDTRIVQQAELENRYHKWLSLQESIGAQMGSVFSLIYLVYISNALQQGTVSFANAAFLLFIINIMTQALGSIYPSVLNLSTIDQLWGEENWIFSEQDSDLSVPREAQIYTLSEEMPKSPAHPSITAPITIQLSGVTYAYPAMKQALFAPITETIDYGQKVLISGPSGVGKTTLLSILKKEIVEYQGSIWINGMDLQSVNEEDWQSCFSVIHQDAHLFSATIAENITMDFSGSPLSAQDESRIHALLQAVEMGEYIDALPDGLNTYLEDAGATLSGGQKSRIAIVRALYHRSPILFVDEPTASLPEDLARKVESLLLEWEGTVIGIYHRSYCDAYDHRISLA